MQDIRYTFTDVIRQELENVLMNTYTSIPAIVQSFDSVKQTVDVLVAVETPTHFGDNIPASTYKGVPVIFPAAADWVIAGPINVGDAVVLVVPHYGTEEYLQGNKDKVGKPKFVSRHDLNDAVAFVGMFTSKSVTRKDAYKDKFHIAQGSNVITLDDAGGIVIEASSSTVTIAPNGEITIDGNITVNGNLTVTGTTTTTGLIANGVNQVLHTHSYTDDGNALVTGPPQ